MRPTRIGPVFRGASGRGLAPIAQSGDAARETIREWLATLQDPLDQCESDSSGVNKTEEGGKAFKPPQRAPFLGPMTASSRSVAGVRTRHSIPPSYG